MATGPEFAAYALEQLGGEPGGVTLRKMFGEYGLHCYGKFFAVLCNDTLYIKPTPAGERLLAARGALAMSPPYEGARDYFRIDDVDDGEFLRELTEATVNALPEPKVKKPKSEKGKGR